jgi:hypothetical protein
MINKSFAVGIKQDTNRFVIRGAVLKGIKIGGDGDSKMTLNVDAEAIDDASLNFAELDSWKDKVVSFSLKAASDDDD